MDILNTTLILNAWTLAPNSISQILITDVSLAKVTVDSVATRLLVPSV